MKAIKKINKNGTFRFELESGEVIVASTKRDYNAFTVGYESNEAMLKQYIDHNSSKRGFTLSKYSSTTKGPTKAHELAINSGYRLPEGYFTVIV